MLYKLDHILNSELYLANDRPNIVKYMLIFKRMFVIIFWMAPIFILMILYDLGFHVV